MSAAQKSKWIPIKLASSQEPKPDAQGSDAVNAPSAAVSDPLDGAVNASTTSVYDYSAYYQNYAMAYPGTEMATSAFAPAAGPLDYAAMQGLSQTLSSKLAKKKEELQRQQKEAMKPKKIVRAAGGEVWEDPTLLEWPDR